MCDGESAVGAQHQFQLVLVNDVVVAVAEQDQIVEVGEPHVAPVDDVVGVAVSDGPVAAWVAAAAIAGCDVSEHGWWHDADPSSVGGGAVMRVTADAVDDTVAQVGVDHCRVDEVTVLVDSDRM